MKQLTLTPERHSAIRSLTRRGSGLWGWLWTLILIAGMVVTYQPRSGMAQSNKSVTWDRIDVTVELRDDSSLHISEQDTIIFQGGPFTKMSSTSNCRPSRSMR